MKEALKYREQAVVSNLNASEVLEPGIGALEFPASSVAPQLAFVIEAAMPYMTAIGSDQIGPLPFHPQAPRLGVVAPIGDDERQVGTFLASANSGE